LGSQVVTIHHGAIVNIAMIISGVLIFDAMILGAFAFRAAKNRQQPLAFGMAAGSFISVITAGVLYWWLSG
jgi:hypothetical protein